MGETRRKKLGERASAALPALWKGLARRNWSLADFARAAGISSSAATQLAWGHIRAGRRVGAFCHAELGVAPGLWDKPVPSNWRPHDYSDLRKRGRAPATGTDG